MVLITAHDRLPGVNSAGALAHSWITQLAAQRPPWANHLTPAQMGAGDEGYDWSGPLYWLVSAAGAPARFSPKEDTMPDLANAPERQDTSSEAKHEAEEIKVVARSEDEPPCQELGPDL
jgi:hypothetical protein